MGLALMSLKSRYASNVTSTQSAAHSECRVFSVNCVLIIFLECDNMSNLIHMHAAVDGTFVTVEPAGATFTAGMTDAESLSVLIESFKALDDVHRELTIDNFNKTRDVILNAIEHAGMAEADGVEQRECAERFCEETEIAWCMDDINVDEETRKRETTKGSKGKPGHLKLSKLLPGPYLSAKSVILNAIEGGVDLFDADGKPLGKSALQKANTANSKTPEEKLAAMLESMKKLVAQCADPETMADMLAQDFNNLRKSYAEKREASDE